MVTVNFNNSVWRIETHKGTNAWLDSLWYNKFEAVRYLEDEIGAAPAPNQIDLDRPAWVKWEGDNPVIYYLFEEKLRS